MDIRMEGWQVLIHGPKCLIVLTKQEFVQALRRGKAYRRAEVAIVAPGVGGEGHTIGKRYSGVRDRR